MLMLCYLLGWLSAALLVYFFENYNKSPRCPHIKKQEELLESSKKINKVLLSKLTIINNRYLKLEQNVENALIRLEEGINHKNPVTLKMYCHLAIKFLNKGLSD